MSSRFGHSYWLPYRSHLPCSRASQAQTVQVTPGASVPPNTLVFYKLSEDHNPTPDPGIPGSPEKVNVGKDV